MIEDKLVAKIDRIIETGKKVIKMGSDFSAARYFSQFRTEGQSLIEHIYGANHIFFKDFRRESEFSYRDHLESSFGILEAIKLNIQEGFLGTQRTLMAAEIFDDALDMASHLLDSGYKDASAVVIGSTLEQELKSLCRNHKIELETEKDGKKTIKKAEVLNHELCKANVYTSTDQKHVTAWLSLRNHAAHGDYLKYTKEEVSIMMLGVQSFIARIK